MAQWGSHELSWRWARTKGLDAWHAMLAPKDLKRADMSECISSGQNCKATHILEYTVQPGYSDRPPALLPDLTPVACLRISNLSCSINDCFSISLPLLMEKDCSLVLSAASIPPFTIDSRFIA